MFLLVKGEKPRAICRQCRALHEAAACPEFRAIVPVTMREYNKARRAAEAREAARVAKEARRLQKTS